MAYYRYKIVFNKSTFGGLLRWPIFVRLAVDASQFPNLRNSPKIPTYSSSRSSKDTDLGVNRKLVCNFLSVINSNYCCISYHFRK